MGAGAVLELEQVNYMMELAMAQAARRGVGVLVRSCRPQVAEVLHRLHSLCHRRGGWCHRASGFRFSFLAGLQSVPIAVRKLTTLSDGLGALWMITFPLVSPLILTSIVYTVIDSFTGSTNALLTLVRTTILTGAGFGASAAVAWVSLPQ